MDEMLKLVGFLFFLDKDELVVNLQVHTFIQCYNQTPIKLKVWKEIFSHLDIPNFNM